MRHRSIAITAILALALAACGGGDTTDTTGAGSGSDTTPAGAPATTGAEPMDGIHVAETDLGPVLANAEGFTLYIFTQDTDGASTCYDSCADLWPPVPGDAALGSDLDPSIFSTITRDDGADQLAVNGMPLYLYVPDASPGDTNGQGVGGVWFVVDGDGSVIEAAAGNVTVDSDY
jgi:predicted lipoprotein with Yx(FWY)xxD motif